MAQKVVQVAVVVAVNMKFCRFQAGLFLVALSPITLNAAILPEDRADAMYHSYEGGGLQVDGPSVLVRKGFKEKVSVWANYYVDMISSASIDVMATASPYSEQRDEKSVGVDYLHGKTSMGLSYTNSEESDYTADTYAFGISQDFFGDLTTLGLSYALGKDEVRRNFDDEFKDQVDRQSFGVSLSQIFTKNMVVNLTYSAITDEGFLNNPYRSVRYADGSSPIGYSYEPEIYPRTRTSSAAAIRSLYYLPYEASVKAEYRYYSDTWGIKASNGELGYTQTLPKGITMDVSYRYYTQDAADFYGDLFPRQQAQNFLARDKELSTFSSHTFGMGLTYEFGMKMLPFFKKGEINLKADYMLFQYDDFRDVTSGAPVGEEPLYDFHSTVLRLFFSVYY